MCVTIILKDYIKNVPLIIGNNRDELSFRNFIPPTVISEKPYIVGGKDMLKGGTWLGINFCGIVVNILNKYKNHENFFGSNKFKSRGILVMELLKQNSPENMLEYLKKLDTDEYLPFFLVIANRDKVFFVEYDNGVNISEINRSLFIAGNLNPFNKSWEKYERGYSHFENLKDKELNKVVNELKTLLKVHTGDKSIPSKDFAVNLGDFCTTSSSILILKENESEYLFANGSPLNSDYQDYSFLLKNFLK